MYPTQISFLEKGKANARKPLVKSCVEPAERGTIKERGKEKKSDDEKGK